MYTLTTSGECIQGLWSDRDKAAHINFLELKAAFLTITRLCNQLNDCHDKVCLDNTVSVTYITKIGAGGSFWEFCMKKNVWVTASHIAGVENVEADYLSRNFNPDMEWMLHPKIFEEINKITGTCDIDLFASRDDKQISSVIFP